MTIKITKLFLLLSVPFSLHAANGLPLIDSSKPAPARLDTTSYGKNFTMFGLPGTKYTNGTITPSERFQNTNPKNTISFIFQPRIGFILDNQQPLTISHSNLEIAPKSAVAHQMTMKCIEEDTPKANNKVMSATKRLKSAASEITEDDDKRRKTVFIIRNIWDGKKLSDLDVELDQPDQALNEPQTDL